MIQRLNQQGDHTHEWDPARDRRGRADHAGRDALQGLRPPDREPRRLPVRAGRRADPRRAAHPRRARRRASRCSTSAGAGARAQPRRAEPARRRRRASTAWTSTRCVDTLGARLDPTRRSPSSRHARRSTARRPRLPTRSEAHRLRMCDAGSSASSVPPVGLTDRPRRSMPRVRVICPCRWSGGAAPRSTRCAPRLRPRRAACRGCGASTETRSATSCARSTAATCPAGPSGAPTRGMAHVLPTGRNFYASTRAACPAAPPGASASSWPTSWSSATAPRRAPTRERRPQHLGHQRDAHPRRRHRRGLRAARRPPALAAGEPAPGRRRGDAAGGAWPAAHRRRVPHLRLLPRRLPAPHRRARRGRAPGRRARRAAEQNFVRKRRFLRRARPASRRGRAGGEAERQARYRVFGSQPGTYGAGILPLIDERNWTRTADFADGLRQLGRLRLHRRRVRRRRPTRTSRPCSAGVAGGGQEPGQPRARHLRLGRLPAVPRRHDRHHPRADRARRRGATSATAPTPRGPRVRDLKEEALRVFRTRVVNPKWIDTITAPRLQGRAGAGRDGRLPVRLRRHRRRGRRLDVRARHADLRPRSGDAGVLRAQQPVGAQGHERAAARSDRARPVGRRRPTRRGSELRARVSRRRRGCSRRTRARAAERSSARQRATRSPPSSARSG